MKKDRSLSIALAFIIAALLVAYMVHSYTAIYERRVGYIYVPKSDDVFRIELAPYLNPFKKWEIFNPLKQISYSRPDGADYLGKLHKLIKEFREDQRLLEKDPDEWSRKFDAEMDAIFENQEEPSQKVIYWDIDYFPRRDEDVTISAVLPSITGADFPKAQLDSGEVIRVDAVIVRREMIFDDSISSSPSSIDVVKEALLFKGAAAYALSREGL